MNKQQRMNTTIGNVIIVVDGIEEVLSMKVRNAAKKSLRNFIIESFLTMHAAIFSTVNGVNYAQMTISNSKGSYSAWIELL